MNPAIPLLLRCQGVARWRSFRATFSNRRRMMLTLAALLFGIVWLGQTVAVVLLRKPYDSETFRRTTSLVLMAYFCWHIVRVAWKRPDAAIEWSPAESEHIVGGPFTRRDRLVYRFLVILTSTLPKALVTAFVLLPDLWWTGLPGIILALVFLECVRTAADIAVCSLSDWTYLAVRMLVFGVVLAAAAMLFVDAGAMSAEATTASTSRLAGLRATADVVFSSTPFVMAERPFVLFADVITAKQLSAALLVNTLTILSLIGGLMTAIFLLERWNEAMTARRQTAMLGTGTRLQDRADGSGSTVVPLPVVPRLATIGPIIWRQMKSAGRYPGSLFVALAIPAVMSCGPFFSVSDPTLAFLVLVGTVVFYSFVLLPEAIKFDFRLDCDHLVQLKALPVSPTRLVIGQLAVPVVMVTLFQVTLFLFAGAVRPVSMTLVTAAILLTLPTNGLFVAVDNLIFLLYPHRPTQEGFEAFLRTILKFTFKSVMLGVIGCVLFCCALSSRILVDAIGVPHLVQWVFVGLTMLVAWVSAYGAIALVTRAFDRFDVSHSVPA